MNSAYAVMDVIAPDARTAPARTPAAANADEPSFQDHLEAATHGDGLPESPTPAEQPPQSETNSEALLGGLESAPVAALVPPPQQSSSPIVVQLIAPGAPAAPYSGTQTAAADQGAMPTTPATPPANEAAPMQVAPAHGKLNAPASANAAPPQSAPSSPQTPAQEQSAAQPPATPQAAPIATMQAAPIAPLTVAPAESGVSATPGLGEVVVAQPVTSSAQISAASAELARLAKNGAARGDAKPDAQSKPDHQQSAPPPTAAPHITAKSAAPPVASKDTAVIQTLDAPEAAQPQLQPASTPPAGQTTQAQQANAEHAAARALPTAHQVAREIVRRFDGGNTRFELRLDPPELGRVEVRLDVTRDHRVNAVIAADSPQALTELARHARELEQMLQGAGLELGENGLSFDLRQNAADEAAEFGEGGISEAATSEDTTAPAARPLGYERWRGVRVDMMV